MKSFNPNFWGVVIGISLFGSVILTSVVNAELVFEDGSTSSQAGRVEDRDHLRQVMSASKKAQDTYLGQPSQIPVEQSAQFPSISNSASVPSPSNVVYVNSQTQAQSSSVQSQDSTEVQNVARSELLRRERIRTEVKNEDILQERLEELRLRDEQRRTDQLIVGSPIAPTAPVTPYGNGGGGGVVTQEQVVVSPITERPGQTAVIPSVSPQGVTHAQEVSSDFADYSEDQTALVIQPRFGLSEILGNSGGYDVRPRFSSGVSLGVMSSEMVSFDLSYTYSEFGIVMNNYNPYIQFIANPYGVQQRSETVTMKQNLIDTGVKLHLLGSSAKIRPFIGGGGGYSFGYVNYDDRLLSQNPYLSQWIGRDYEVKSFLGYLSTGFDVRVGRSVSIGAVAKYYDVLSSREQGYINNALLWGGYPVVGVPDADKQYIGGTLVRTNFYTLMGSVSFSF